MKVQHLDHLNLSVANLDDSIAWYRRVFAFEPVEGGVRNGVRWAIVRSGDAILCMYEHPRREHLDLDARREREIHAVNHFALRISDREAWEEVIERERVPVQFEGVVENAHSLAWYVNDPTGYEIEVALWHGNGPRFPGV